MNDDLLPDNADYPPYTRRAPSRDDTVFGTLALITLLALSCAWVYVRGHA